MKKKKTSDEFYFLKKMMTRRLQTACSTAVSIAQNPSVTAAATRLTEKSLET